MTGEQVTRRVYSAEELHRLRVSCSQPKLREAIEERDGDDAELVKEHVLRGTKSFTARSFRSRTSGNSLRVPSNKENRSTADAENSVHSSSGQDIPLTGPVLGEISANGQLLRSGIYRVRPSPTPSLKKKKAEAIVKAHGSPQHVRVTAGGRIVPSEQSPLCHPRYGYSAIKTNGGLIKFAPNHPLGKTQWTQATQNGFVAQDVNGRLCQIVNGTILPLNEVDGALRLYIPAPNLNITSRGPSFGQPPARLGDTSNQARTSSSSKPISPPEPPLPTQTNALELEYSKLEHELKELDKTEVLHGRTMGKAAKEALVAKRRELIITLDNIRRAIKSIKSIPLPAEAPASPHSPSNRQSMSPPRTRLPVFLQQPQRGRHGQEIDVAAGMPPPLPPSSSGPFFGFAQAMQYPPTYAGFPQSTPPDVGAYDNAVFGMHQHQQQPSLFMPPAPQAPGFDGTLPPPFIPYAADRGMPPTTTQQAMPPPAAALDGASNPHHLPPQTDGATASFTATEVQKIRSPGRSHAVDIKPPLIVGSESKTATTALKSNLNPMSPAYKPAAGIGVGVLRGTTNTNSHTSTVTTVGNPGKDGHDSPSHQLPHPLSTGAGGKGMKNDLTDETLSSPSAKRTPPHLHSSSVSSFETADFFPRDTREYSVRRWAYPDGSSTTASGGGVQRAEEKEGKGQGEKENVSPEVEKKMDLHPGSAGGVAGMPSTPPPSASVGRERGGRVSQSHEDLEREKDKAQFELDLDLTSIPDRQAHNLSPKSRRQPEHVVPLPPLPQLGAEEPTATSKHDKHTDLLSGGSTTISGEQEPISSPAAEEEKYHPCRSSAPSPSPASTHIPGLTCTAAPVVEAKGIIDYSSLPAAWLEGYRAGLARQAVEADRAGVFLDGYCAGLLKSRPAATAPTSNVGAAGGAGGAGGADAGKGDSKGDSKMAVVGTATDSGSPIRVPSRRPSPAVLQAREENSSRLALHEVQLQRELEHDTSSHHATETGNLQHQQKPQPFETTKLHSMDTLKEAVFAPANEDAILSPVADGMHVSEAVVDLGAWGRNHQQKDLAAAGVICSGNPADKNGVEGLSASLFPRRTASVVKRLGVCMSEDDILVVKKDSSSSAAIAGRPMGFASEDTPLTHSTQPGSRLAELSSGPPQNASASTPGSTTGHAASQAPAAASANRVLSLPGIDSHLYAQWPGARVFSNQLDWKSAGSVAQATGLSGGYFAHIPSGQQRQDGYPSLAQHQRPLSSMSNTSTAGMTPHPHSHAHAHSHSQSRFKEASLDGISNPPNSPQSLTLCSPSPSPTPLSPSSLPPLAPSNSRRKSNTPTKTPKSKDGKSRDGKSKREGGGGSGGSSPMKTLSISPTKLKLESMAERVGIKVASSSSLANAGSLSAGGGNGFGAGAGAAGGGKKEKTASPHSPPGKRGWRDVWRGSRQ